MRSASLDAVDCGILFALHQDARNTTIADIADEGNVSASTVRNRIECLEDEGVIEGYYPKINYERAQFPLNGLFVCSAPANERNELAATALDSPGVVDVREMLTGVRNLHIEVIAVGTNDLASITNDLSTMGFEIVSPEIITDHYVHPWAQFELTEGEE